MAKINIPSPYKTEVYINGVKRDDINSVELSSGYGYAFYGECIDPKYCPKEDRRWIVTFSDETIMFYEYDVVQIVTTLLDQ